MYLDDLVTIAQTAVKRALSPQSGAPLALDATAGNGNDTAFLAETVGTRGRVLALDVQESALNHTRSRLAEAGLLERVLLLQAGHEDIAVILPEGWAGRINTAMYNLGFLPGAAGSARQYKETPLGGFIHTTLENTVHSLTALLPLLAKRALLSVHCYAGHPGGAEESAGVEKWFTALPWREWRVGTYAFCNKERNPERLFLAERIL